MVVQKRFGAVERTFEAIVGCPRVGGSEEMRRCRGACKRALSKMAVCGQSARERRYFLRVCKVAERDADADAATTTTVVKA